MAAWLDPDRVAGWLKLPLPLSDDDAALMADAAAEAERVAELYRPEWWDDDDDRVTYTPDAETLGGATRLAGRIWRRRNSPAGIETFAESTMYVARFDPEIERALRMSGWLRPNRVYG